MLCMPWLIKLVRATNQHDKRERDGWQHVCVRGVFALEF